MAVELAQGKEAYFKERDEIIRTYKEQGRRSEIAGALAALKWEAKESEIPKDLCWLYGEYLEDYLHDVEICQAFARRNREVMADILIERAGLDAPGKADADVAAYCGADVNDGMDTEAGPDAQDVPDSQDGSARGFHTVHNYIDTSEMILRKGAIAAHKGEKVLIPLNMRDGSVLAVGRGSEEWNYSAPHGAGRIMSRTKAKANLDLGEYERAMKGIYTTSVSRKTLDEAPMAYKAVGDIIDVIKESVDVIDIMKPIYNYKAG